MNKWINKNQLNKWINIYIYMYVLYVCGCSMDLRPRSLTQGFWKSIRVAGLMASRSPGSKSREWLPCVNRVTEMTLRPLFFSSVEGHKECHQEASPSNSCLTHCLLIVAKLGLNAMMVLKIRRQRPRPWRPYFFTSCFTAVVCVKLGSPKSRPIFSQTTSITFPWLLFELSGFSTGGALRPLGPSS